MNKEFENEELVNATKFENVEEELIGQGAEERFCDCGVSDFELATSELEFENDKILEAIRNSDSIECACKLFQEFENDKLTKAVEVDGIFNENNLVCCYESGLGESIAKFTDANPTNRNFVVGSSVRLSANAVWYGTSNSVPQFVRDRISQVMEIIGNRVVITYQGAVVGAVRLQDLILVSGGGGGGGTPGGGDGSSTAINRIGIALGSGSNDRALSAITQIVIHHSANPTNGMHLNTAVFEGGWRGNTGMGFPSDNRGGYHEVVLFNGNVEVNMQDLRRTWGATGQNGHTWHIAVTGQHAYGINNISNAQLSSLAVRIAAAMRRFGWNANHVNRIVRHRDLPGQNTGCNDINVGLLREQVRAILSTPTSPNPTLSAADRQRFEAMIRTQLGHLHNAINIPANLPASILTPGVNLIFFEHNLPAIPPTCISPLIRRKVTIQRTLASNHFHTIEIRNGSLSHNLVGDPLSAVLGMFGLLNEQFNFNRFLGNLNLPNVKISLASDGGRPALDIKIPLSFTLQTGEVISFELKLRLTPNGVPMPCPTGGNAAVVTEFANERNRVQNNFFNHLSGLNIPIGTSVLIGALAVAVIAAAILFGGTTVAAAIALLVISLNDLLRRYQLPAFQN